MRPECTYKRAIVRTPCRNMVHGITTAALGKPDYERALMQHQQYVEALKDCGLGVTVLPADERYPDSMFVEDTALLIPECAIITNPGAHSRKGEITEIKKIVADYYSIVEQIHPPGTVDGGDVLEVGDNYYIGLSGRTNPDGANQIVEILQKYGKKGFPVEIRDMLHLKSGIAYLGNNHVVMNSSFNQDWIFRNFKSHRIDECENYAANCIRVNDKVIFPRGYVKTKTMLENSGFSVKEVDVSEFRKLDGGVSCLSLRF